MGHPRERQPAVPRAAQPAGAKRLAHHQRPDHRTQGTEVEAFKGWTLRRVEARVEVDGTERVMVFITSNTAWSARSVYDLYRARWEIEVVKQTLKLGGFLGHSANAIRWQVWSALLVYVLLRFSAHLSAWHHSFVRLFAVVPECMSAPEPGNTSAFPAATKSPSKTSTPSSSKN
jgi:hypothetical protein